MTSSFDQRRRQTKRQQQHNSSSSGDEDKADQNSLLAATSSSSSSSSSSFGSSGGSAKSRPSEVDEQLHGQRQRLYQLLADLRGRHCVTTAPPSWDAATRAFAFTPQEVRCMVEMACTMLWGKAWLYNYSSLQRKHTRTACVDALSDNRTSFGWSHPSTNVRSPSVLGRRCSL